MKSLLNRFVLAFLVFILASCASVESFKKMNMEEAGKGIDLKEYGLVVFSIYMHKNLYQDQPLVGTLRDLRNRRNSFPVYIRPGDISYICIWAKKGKYVLEDFSGETTSQTMMDLTDGALVAKVSMAYSWSFEVKPGRLNYGGRIEMDKFGHTNHDTAMVYYYASTNNKYYHSDLYVRKNMSDVSTILEKYPILKKKQLPIRIDLLQTFVGSMETYVNISKTAEKARNEKNGGYGEYKWGLSLSDIKRILEIKDKKVMVVAQDYLVDNTAAENPVAFHFKKLKGEYVLHKVEVALSIKSYDSYFANLLKKYGSFVSNKNGTTKWITPDSTIVLIKSGKKLRLVYEQIQTVSDVKKNNSQLVQ